MYCAKIEESFKVYTSYLSEIIDEGTKTTPLTEAKWEIECLRTRQENMEVETFEEYIIVLSFKLLQMNLCTIEIMLEAKVKDPDNSTPIFNEINELRELLDDMLF